MQVHRMYLLIVQEGFCVWRILFIVDHHLHNRFLPEDVM